MCPKEARFAALRAFGNPALLREQTRATWSWNGLESLIHDVRFGVRTLRRTPGFTAVAIVVMALGIGANVALFTVVRSVLLKPLPFADPDRLLMLYERPAGDAQNIVSPGIFNEWKKFNQSFSHMAAVQMSDYELSGTGGQLPERLKGALCSWNLLSTLGIHPALGRDFSSSDDNPSANGTVLLSWRLWQRRYGSDPGIVGRTVNLNAKPYTVIGVMPAWYVFPEPSTQLWTPAFHEMSPAFLTAYDYHMFDVVGRLRPGVSPAQATADLSAINLRIHNQHLDNPFVFKAASARPLLEHIVGDLKRPLYVLLAATGCLLLIACLNVANLLVARAAARRKEMAIRTALGGGWLRLLRERLIESLLLSAAGGAAGLALAYATLFWFARTRQDMARADGIHIDSVVAAFTIAIVVCSALFSGLISAFSANDRQTLSALQESSRSVSGSNSRAMLRKSLVSIEVGLTVALLIGAGLLLRSYQRLRSTSVGCDTQNVLTMRIDLPAGRYATNPQRANFYDTLLTRVRALPGVQAAGFNTVAPGQGYVSDWFFKITEHPPLPIGVGNTALMRWADPGYFAALGIPILRGHTFDDNQRLDRTNQVIVSDGLARHFFPGEDPLGKHIQIRDYPPAIVVGIVGDTRYTIGEAPKPTQYYPLFKGESKGGTLVIRSTHNVEALALPVQRIVSNLDRDLPVADVLTMDQMLGKSTLSESFNATLLLAFAILALLLAAVGLFGVLSYIVAQRTTEIGIRIALGAQREQVLRRILFDGLRPALFGLVLGLAASAATVRLLRSMLYQTQPLDPAVFALVAATLLSVAALACTIPAWRASRLDPMQALRTE
jgi:putative ABC transport system permease protein